MTMTIDIQKSWRDGAAKRLHDEAQFDAWFDTAADRHTTIANATIDFYQRIMTQEVYEHLGDPREKACLEIGCGGGRLLNAALRVFRQAIGIDVSTSDVFSFVRSRIESEHGENRLKLFHRDDVADIQDEIIDFAYSYIVFQHFSSFDEVEFYISLLARVLKQGGVGHICFRAHQKTEVFYDQFVLNDRAETLNVAIDDMANVLNKNGFQITGCSPLGPKKVWNPRGPVSSQTSIRFVKR